ncbi:hypothetical protein [Streptomyces sp. NPDC002763]|uniref:hypothetical protein n=1 Tax=Streptomyces sp. NPDC002763 TaxID=3154427 RepID=UPI003321793A
MQQLRRPPQLFTPHGQPADDRFTESGFTSQLVRYFNGWANEALERTMNYTTTGAALPVFRLSTASSLVACTYDREHRVSGAGASGTVRFDKGTDTDVLLGGGSRERHSVREISSMTALTEAPARKAAPATVLACDCYAPQLLSATGVQPRAGPGLARLLAPRYTSSAHTAEPPSRTCNAGECSRYPHRVASCTTTQA